MGQGKLSNVQALPVSRASYPWRKGQRSSLCPPPVSRNAWIIRGLAEICVNSCSVLGRTVIQVSRPNKAENERALLTVCRHLRPNTLGWRKHHGSQRLKEASELDQCDIVITTFQTIASEWKRSRHTSQLIFVKQWHRVILDEGKDLCSPRMTCGNEGYSTSHPRCVHRDRASSTSSKCTLSMGSDRHSHSKPAGRPDKLTPVSTCLPIFRPQDL